MSRLYGGVETGGTWCVCAVGTGRDDIAAEQQFPTTTPGVLAIVLVASPAR